MHFRSRRKSGSDVSLSELIDTGSDGAALELQDVVAGEEDLLEELSARENARRLHAAVERVLTEQEKEVVCMRYGLLGQLPKKQWEVADTLGISRSYVSRIEKRALGKLREVLGEKLRREKPARAIRPGRIWRFSYDPRGADGRAGTSGGTSVG